MATTKRHLPLEDDDEDAIYRSTSTRLSEARDILLISRRNGKTKKKCIYLCRLLRLPDTDFCAIENRRISSTSSSDDGGFVCRSLPTRF